jgi:hypothetical protein
METKLLLVLERAHGGERTELMVQRGYGHARHGREFLNAERLGVIRSEPFDSFGGAMALLSQRGDSAQMLSLGTAKKAIDDFAVNEATEKRDVLRSVKQVEEP